VRSWPLDNIQMNAIDTWIPMGVASKYAMVHLPLSDAVRANFDAAAAEAFILNSIGLPYGYHKCAPGVGMGGGVISECRLATPRPRASPPHRCAQLHRHVLRRERQPAVARVVAVHRGGVQLAGGRGPQRHRPAAGP
jgi:hypothetical protein